MSKKSEEKLIDKILETMNKENMEFERQTSLFYKDGILVDIISTPDKDPFLNIFETLPKNISSQTLTEEEMLEKCLKIREYINLGRRDNIEIDFRKMVEQFNSSNYDLHYTQINSSSYDLNYTLIKVRAMDADTPIYIQAIKGDSLNSLIFIGGDDKQAFLVTKDKDGHDAVIELEEFNMVSFSENSTLEKEIGLITEYSYRKALIAYGAMLGLNLNSAKTILLPGHLRDLYLEPQKKQ